MIASVLVASSLSAHLWIFCASWSERRIVSFCFLDCSPFGGRPVLGDNLLTSIFGRAYIMTYARPKVKSIPQTFSFPLRPPPSPRTPFSFPLNPLSFLYIHIQFQFHFQFQCLPGILPRQTFRQKVTGGRNKIEITKRGKIQIKLGNKRVCRNIQVVFRPLCLAVLRFLTASWRMILACDLLHQKRSCLQQKSPHCNRQMLKLCRLFCRLFCRGKIGGKVIAADFLPSEPDGFQRQLNGLVVSSADDVKGGVPLKKSAIVEVPGQGDEDTLAA